MSPRISVKFIYAAMALKISTAFFQITLDFNLVLKSDLIRIFISKLRMLVTE